MPDEMTQTPAPAPDAEREAEQIKYARIQVRILRAKISLQTSYCNKAIRERDAALAELARLRAENAGLREENERIGRELIARYDDTDRLHEKTARLATNLDQLRLANEEMRKALGPFAEVYRWAAENEDPSKIDFIIRHFDRGNLGHLQVQMDDFGRARAALSSEPQT